MFRHTLDDIEAAYQAAAKAHVDRPDEIERKVRLHLGLGPDDPFPDRNDDDDYDPVGRLYDEAGEMEERATRGAHIVRKAFLIALFHHWERHCNKCLGWEKYGHPRKWLESHGHADCVVSIRELQKAANCAKHGPGNSCKELYRMRPDLFPRVKSPSEAKESLLVIDRATLDAFFSTVRKASFLSR
jgi:hypothetical protein